jgi:hypothetical protein
MQKADIYYHRKIRFPDGSIAFGIIWKLSKPTKERPHGYKYRLNYCVADGTIILRYDNETGKGDHKHLGDKEFPYIFKSIDALIADFWNDLEHYRKDNKYE